MGEKSDCQGVQLVSLVRDTRNGVETKDQDMSSIKETFDAVTTAKQYKAALAGVRALSGTEQLTVLDSMFAAADRLGLERSTGRPLGMQQELDGSVTVTWGTKCTRPDGSSFRVVSSAVLEPTDFGNGWRSRSKDVPDDVVDAVTAAAMNNELKTKPLAKSRRRVYVKA